MSQKPYSRIKKEEKELILRDYLAVDRTLLSNETAFLSYIRTSLTMLVAGVTLMHLFDTPSMNLFGWSLIVGSGIMAWIGTHRYNANQRALVELVEEGENNTAQGRRYMIVTKLYNAGHALFKKI